MTGTLLFATWPKSAAVLRASEGKLSLSQRILRALGAAIACASIVALSLTTAQPAAAAVTVIRHTLPVADQGVEPA